MSRTTILNISLGLILFFILCALVGLSAYYADLPQRVSQHETIVLGQDRLVPGSQAALRVVVRDSKDASPLSGARIQVSLKPQDENRPQVVFSGETDQRGSALVAFRVPEDLSGKGTLLVETESELGLDLVERAVKLERDYRVLLTTDKPLYQPGQVIHLRALALSAFDLTPAAAHELEIIIADGKGNKVFRKALNTNEFGVAATDFQLAREVNTGPYKITASLGDTSSEKTVTVEHYVLPKFEVTMQTTQPFYLPGERVEGVLSAGYFFGKPVGQGQVEIEAFSFDVSRDVFVELQGETDEAGQFEFQFELPPYFAGTELEGGLGRFYLQATVVDQAQHSETSNLSLPVAQNSLVIDVVPEGGTFRAGVENILYVLTSYPDGSPAETDLNLTFAESGETFSIPSGPYGLAELRMTPQSPRQQLTVLAQDAQGNAASKDFYFEGEWFEETVLLRPEKPVYTVGETMYLDVLTSAPKGTVYVDIVRQGQTVSTRSLEVDGGRAEIQIDLTPDLYGTLQLHAYKILASGHITRDTRLVVVDNAQDLSIDLTTDQDTYLPGGSAALKLLVKGQTDRGVQSAIGLAIVDESVFALAEQDPGFAKLYFMLEQELLQPKYDLHGFSVPDLVTGLPISAEPTIKAVQSAAQASLSASSPIGPAFSLQANSHDEAIERSRQRQSAFFSNMSKGLFGAFLSFPLATAGLTIYALVKKKLLGRSLNLVFWMLVLLLIGSMIVPLGDAYGWVVSPLDRLTAVMEWLSYRGEGLVILAGLLGLVGYLTLIVAAWRLKDGTLGWSLALLPVAFGVFGLIAFSLSQADVFPSEATVISGLLAFALMPLAFTLRFAGFLWDRRLIPAVGSILVAVFLLVGALPVLSFGAQGAFRAAAVQDGRDFLIEPGVVLEGAALPAEMPEAEVVPQENGKSGEAASTSTGNQPPRLRQYFPETMLWLPDAVTDESGSLNLDIPIADSITTWRMTVLASSQDGRLGSTTAGLRVFQDFFVDLDLPPALTVGDEISVPVGVFNYLQDDQTVRLELERSDWFELLDEPVKEINIVSNDIDVVYFRVRALDFGRKLFKVTAWGSHMSDAIQKEVQVFPDGKQINFTQSDRLTPGDPVEQRVNIPAEAIPGTQTILVKIYPGVVSQVVEGLESILRMPFGCFEQTSSTTYPNVLVLDYLKSSGQASPEVQFKAEEYINLGYQRLTTFEVGGSGGFSLFGSPPADRMLTAYGLREFSDMSRVHQVDPDLVARAAEWLLSQQGRDGSWENDRGLVHENTWSNLKNDRLPVSAYIVWSLVEAGFGDDPRTVKGIAYVRERVSQADDPYVLALVANALVAADLDQGGGIDSATQAVLDRLAGMAVQEGSGVYWTSGVATFMGSQGRTGSIETTALAALAFLRADRYPDKANAALTHLIQAKDSFGTWHSTQATVLALKALIQTVRAGAESVEAEITLSLNGSQTRTIQVGSENFDVVQLVRFDDLRSGADNLVEIRAQGEGSLMYQVSGSYYLPWDKLALYRQPDQGKDLLSIDIAYDRTELSVNDTVKVDVSVALEEGNAESALIDLGVPPGFSVQVEDLSALVSSYNDVPEDYAFPTIERYELTGRQILVYVSNLRAGNPLQFSYHLQAKFPLAVQSPASNAYDYYNPDISGEAAPQTLLVRQ